MGDVHKDISQSTYKGDMQCPSLSPPIMLVIANGCSIQDEPRTTHIENTITPTQSPTHQIS